VTRYRQFVIAPSLARLIQRERGGELVLEGYFPDHPHQNVQNAWVQVEENRSSLVLPDPGPEQHSEERTDLPLASAQALLAVTAGQVEYSCTGLAVGSRTVQLQRFTRPAPLDLLLVEVGQEDEGAPLWPWLGPDVTAEPAYLRRRMALDGLPAAPEVDLTNEALNSLLDALEGRASSQPPVHQGGGPEEVSGDRVEVSDLPLPPIDADQDTNDLDIEDEVIRELARSLRPYKS
jgi:CYTH domain-containing protein